MLKNYSEKLTWEKLLTRKNSIFMDSMKLFGSSRVYVDLGYDYRIKNYKIVNDVNYIAQDWTQYINDLKAAYRKNNQILNNIYNSGIKNIKKLEKRWLIIKNENLSELSDKELKKHFDNYIDSLYILMAYLFTPLFAEKIITENLIRIITKYADESRVNELLPILSAPEKFSATQKESIDFSQMMKKLGSDQIKNNQLIKKHLAKWAWLGDHNYIGGFWTTKYIKEQINDMRDKNFEQEVRHVKEEITKNKIIYRQTIKNWPLSKEEEKMIDLAKKFAFFRTYRLDALFYSEFLVQNLWHTISKKLNLKYGQLMMLTPWEINMALEKDKSDFKKIMQNRKRSCAILLQNYKINVYSGKEADKFFETNLESEQPATIKGQIAYKGLIKGKVRIIFTKADFGKFKDSEILVTAMTTPDFVPLMKRCSAIITDEGGITCHAAIVSREMKKPCIIGTKHATQILKDGDFVEVDANNGIIKITKN